MRDALRGAQDNPDEAVHALVEFATASREKRGTSFAGLLGRLPRPETWVIYFMFLYMLTFSVLAIWRHEIYSSARFDLGNMDQAVWNSAHGRILEATGIYGENASRLENHADFLLLLFVPLYWIWASPYWLLIAQSVVVGLGALPLYWISRRFLGRLPGGEWAAALIPVAYLFNYGIQSANYFDFHAQTMAATFLLFAFHYLLERRLWPFVAFAVLASLCKEEISLIVAVMGLYAVWPLKRPQWGAPIFAIGVGYFIFVMKVLLPAFDTGGGTDLISQRYGEVGGSIGGFVETLFTDPLFVLQYALSGNKGVYLFLLASFGGFVGLLAPHVLAIPVAELAINLLSSRSQMSEVYYHYAAPVIPFVFAAAAAGVALVGRGAMRVGGRMPAAVFVVGLALSILLSNAWSDYQRGPLPINDNNRRNPVFMKSMPDQYVKNIDEALSLIPEDAKVSASNWIAPHLTHRQHLYLFPTIEDAGYAVVDLARPSYYDAVDPPLANSALRRKLLGNPEFRLIYHRENVAVFKRVEP